jgi:hypothetical protein
METNYKIAIPKPCHEDWDKMSPHETGRFCNSCIKSVVDFTTMKPSEIQQYFIKNQGKSVCGRFKNEQLNTIIIQIPRAVLFSQIHFHKIFILALLITMGTTLFSCQNSNGDKQKIDGIEVVDSTKKNMTVGVLLPPKNTKTKGEVVPKPYLTGDVAVEPYNPKPTLVNKYAVYTASNVEVKPSYPGGLIKFYDYFKSNFKVPEEHKDKTGRIILSFVVDTDGSLTDIKLLRGINAPIDNEVLNLLKASPKWIPGEQNGEKVKVSYSLPIKITAQ